MPESLCFDDFDPVADDGTPTPGPEIDGFFMHDVGLENAAELERGYVRGSRFTYDDGSYSSVVFQGVKAQNHLVLGFFNRFDQTFDNEDVLVIAIRPSAASPPTQWRRI